MLSNSDVLMRFVLALIASSLVGFEREKTGHPAGLRTHMLVCIGATLITSVSVEMFPTQPAMIAAQIVTGIGFLGAGTIFKSKNHVQGLTTAASIWTIAGVGIAIGSGAYFLGLIATLAMLVIFSLWRMETLLRRN
jgi:putative Mg2+ transporter-C (MgtC) family protein